MITICAYDISNDVVRHRWARELQRHGCLRLQKSVFCGEISSGKYIRLRELSQYIELTDNDHLVLWRMSKKAFCNGYMRGHNIELIYYLKSRGDTLFL